MTQLQKSQRELRAAWHAGQGLKKGREKVVGTCSSRVHQRPQSLAPPAAAPFYEAPSISETFALRCKASGI
jgi:hypothetical protein